MSSIAERYYNKDIDISLFIACYNEEEAIIRTINNVLKAVDTVGCSADIIVIDDGSTDKSVALVQKFQKENPDAPVRLVINDENKGLAQNFIEGSFIGYGKYYRLICGDDAEPVETLVTILGHIGKADMVIPYYLDVVGKSFFRKKISKLFAMIVNFISGYNVKHYNGMPIFLRYDVMRWHTNYRGFGFQADMVTRLLSENRSYIEIPVTAQEREAGNSKALNFVNLCSVAHTFMDIMIRRVGTMIRDRKREYDYSESKN